MNNRIVPVYLLAGFLGSGKTTLLKRWLEAAEASGRKPAVLMNELGDIQLESLRLGGDVRMSEMLGGCICCTVRGDLGMELLKLIGDHQPDVLLIEATGAANPLDIIDAVTDASMMQRVELRQIVTVVDAAHLQEQLAKGKGRTYRLMQEQIRCATILLLNKVDRIADDEAAQLERALRGWNAYAPIYRTVQADIDIALLEAVGGPVPDDAKLCDARGQAPDSPASHAAIPNGAHEHACAHQHADEHQHAREHHYGHQHHHEHEHHHHHFHEHVMAYTHYFDRPIDSESFEALMGRLPDNVYRAKGVLSFTDTSSRFMFQYAFRQLDLMKIAPQGDVPDVAIFIGEHFDRTALAAELAKLTVPR
jgi:G3E family GTPase